MSRARECSVAFYSGGNWNNGAMAGLFAVNGNNPRSNSNWNIGFRSALPHSQMLAAQVAVSQYKVGKGLRFRAIGEKLKQRTHR